MGGAQPLAITMNEGVCLAAEVEEWRIQKRIETRYIDLIIHDIDEAIDRAILAKQNKDSKVEIWGTGKPYREFLHVDDLANACFFLMHNYNEAGIVNIGVGEDISIKELANLIASEVGYTGSFEFDTTKHDGTPRKLMDTTKINNLGWKASIGLKEGIKKTIEEVMDKF